MSKKSEAYELKKQNRTLHNQIAEAWEMIKNNNIRITEIEYGFLNGEKVLFNGKKAVIKIEGGTFPGLKVRLIKSNGEVSKNFRHVYIGSDVLQKEGE